MSRSAALMPEVFLSYSSKDKARAERVAAALEGCGLSTGWDRNLPPGVAYRREIGRQLDTTGSVIVPWSKDSVELDFVCDETLPALAATSASGLRVLDGATIGVAIRYRARAYDRSRRQCAGFGEMCDERAEIERHVDASVRAAKRFAIEIDVERAVELAVRPAVTERCRRDEDRRERRAPCDRARARSERRSSPPMECRVRARRP